MAVFGKVAKWADSRLTPYGRKKSAFLKNPCDETFGKFSSTALGRIARKARNAVEHMGEAPALERTLKDTMAALMQPKWKNGERFVVLAEGMDALAAKLPVCGRRAALDRFAMNAYIEAAQIYHTEGEDEYADGDRKVAVGKYRQAFGCWEKAIVKMEDIRSTLSAENILQYYMWAAGSANKADMRKEAQPYLKKLMHEARNGHALDNPRYNDAVRRIAKYLVMLRYADEAVKIYADRLGAFPAEKAKPMLDDIFGISYELNQPIFGELVMEKALGMIETQIRMFMKMADGAAPVDERLDLIENMAAAWKAQKFDDGFSFADKKEILASLDFTGRVAGRKG